MFKQQHVLPLSLIQLFSGVNLWLARLRGGEGEEGGGEEGIYNIIWR